MSEINMSEINMPEWDIAQQFLICLDGLLPELQSLDIKTNDLIDVLRR